MCVCDIPGIAQTEICQATHLCRACPCLGGKVITQRGGGGLRGVAYKNRARRAPEAPKPEMANITTRTRTELSPDRSL